MLLKKSHQIFPFILCGPSSDHCSTALIFLKGSSWNGITDPSLWDPTEGDEGHALDQPLQWWSCACAAFAWLLWIEKCVLQLFCHCSSFLCHWHPWISLGIQEKRGRSHGDFWAPLLSPVSATEVLFSVTHMQIFPPSGSLSGNFTT